MGVQAAGVIYLRSVRRRAVDHHPFSRIHQSPKKLAFCICRSAIPVKCASSRARCCRWDMIVSEVCCQTKLVVFMICFVCFSHDPNPSFFRPLMPFLHLRFAK